tara:strand:- start:102 stop:512 length:411 start_codon:yes stop_codon:yes gene_type:complete
MDELESILTNDIHNNLINTTKQQISKEKNDILQKLNLQRDMLKSLNHKLKDYRYIDDLTDLKTGYYLRWYNINNNTLMKGGWFIDIKLLENGCHVICRRFNKQIIQVKLEENILFQKLSNEEKIILKAIELLSAQS